MLPAHNAGGGGPYCVGILPWSRVQSEENTIDRVSDLLHRRNPYRPLDRGRFAQYRTNGECNQCEGRQRRDGERPAQALAVATEAEKLRCPLSDRYQASAGAGDPRLALTWASSNLPPHTVYAGTP